MIKFNTFPGFIGSEIERAAMVSGIYPTESRLEAIVKRRLARGLAAVAGKLDPKVFGSVFAQRTASVKA